MNKKTLITEERKKKVPTKDCPGDSCRGTLVLTKEGKTYSDYECEVCKQTYAMDKKGLGIKRR